LIAKNIGGIGGALWITLLIASHRSPAKPGKSRTWLGGVQKARFRKPNEIKHLHALRFLERGIGGRTGFVAPQHAFCA
jgi:hypothetical protein